MPTYEYQCLECKSEAEAFQKITEEPLKTCPKCHQDTLKRKIGGGLSTFQFKGSGFYITDYQNNKTKSKK